MILSTEKLKEIALKYSIETPEWIRKARIYNTELKALVKGEKFSELLMRIEHLENSQKAEARKKYSHSVKDLFARLLRPLDNIYSTNGTSKNYGDYQKIKDKTAKVRDGKSLEKWLQINWLDVCITDPNGVIFWEWEKEGKYYPTYKSIQNIRAYEADGQRLEWIMFEAKNDDGKMIWRIVDDAYDYEFQVNQNEIIFEKDDKTGQDEIYANPFRRCPGLVNSDRIKIGTYERLSPIDNIIDLAKEFLRDTSIKTLFKFLHGFPLFWRLAQSCTRCAGAGKIGEEKCTDCDGVGYYIKKDITDGLMLPVPEQDQIKLAPDIAGYVVPPLEMIEEYRLELQLMESLMYQTEWGTTINRGEKNETATGRFIDVQPVINSLNVWSDLAEYVEKEHTDLIANYEYQTKNINEEYASINYGRNFIIEPLSVLIERYEKSKKEGDNTAILDRQLQEILLSKYKNNQSQLDIELKRISVEPYLHYDAVTIFTIFGSNEAKKKMLFQMFWINVQNKDLKSKEVLVTEYNTYLESYKITPDEVKIGVTNQ